MQLASEVSSENETDLDCQQYDDADPKPSPQRRIRRESEMKLARQVQRLSELEESLLTEQVLFLLNGYSI